MNKRKKNSLPQQASSTDQASRSGSQACLPDACLAAWAAEIRAQEAGDEDHPRPRFETERRRLGQADSQNFENIENLPQADFTMDWAT